MHFSKIFWGGMPPDPLGGSCFAFWSVLHTLQVNPPAHKNLNFILTPSLDPLWACPLAKTCFAHSLVMASDSPGNHESLATPLVSNPT